MIGEIHSREGTISHHSFSSVSQIRNDGISMETSEKSSWGTNQRICPNRYKNVWTLAKFYFRFLFMGYSRGYSIISDFLS